MKGASRSISLEIQQDGFKSMLRLFRALSLVLLILALASIGYMTVEGWNFSDAFFMSLTTMTTVGYREVRPLTDAGRTLTIFVIFFGVGSVFYTIAVAVEVMLEIQIKTLFGMRRIMKQIKNLQDHYILCGYGRVGHEIAKELLRANKEFIIIDVNKVVIEEALENGRLAIRGSATHDEILRAAGVERAKGLLVALSSDADNVFVTLSAKTINPNIFTVARGEDEESARKLALAGADRVVSPYSIGGRKMASLLIKPFVSDYLDTVSHGQKLEFELEELHINEDSSLVGKTIGQAKIRDETGALILAIHRHGKINRSPAATEMIKEGDVFLAIGTDEQLNDLYELSQGKK